MTPANSHVLPENHARSTKPAVWLKTFLFGAAFFLLTELGTYLSSEHGVFIHFWLPGGLYLAALLLVPTRHWPGLVVAAVIANFLFNILQGTAPLAVAGFCLANTVQAVLGAWLIRRFVAEALSLTSLKEFWGLLVFGVVLTPALGALIGAASLTTFGISGDFIPAWENWWTYNSMGILTLCPFVLVWFSKPERQRYYLRSTRNILELVLLLAATFMTVYYVLLYKGGILSPYKVVIIPFLLYSGLRFDRRGATTMTLLLPLVTIYITDHYFTGLTPAQLASGQENEANFILKCNLILVPLIGLLPAIVLEERELTLGSLRESEDRFRALIEQAPVALSISREGKTLYVNQKYLALYRFGTVAEVVGQPVSDQWAPEFRPLIEERARQRARGEQIPNEYDGVGQRKDGARFPVRVAVGVVELQDGPASLALLSDITERKASEESLKLFRALIDHADDAIEVLDPATARYLDVSEKALQLHGYTREEYLARTVFDMNPELADDPEAWKARLAEVKRTGSIVHETQHKRKDGSVFDVEISATYVKLERDYLLAVVRDITDRRLMAAQLRQAQKMEAVGQLAGGVAHDFNNILAVIMMQADVMGEDEAVPKGVRDGLEQIRAASERAANLTRQLLLFSRKQVMQSDILDLNTVVTTLTRMLQRLIREDVTLHLQLHPEPLYTQADASMLDQILLNLAVNARDAMPQGGRLTIATSAATLDEAAVASFPDARPGSYVCLSVEDTGAGIPPDVMPHIYEPFFTTKEPGQGSGLGLATVFSIVKQHRGILKVDSIPGRGTRFQVFLPASEKGRGPRASQVMPKPRRGTETILLVEDEAQVRSLTRTILERYGYTVLDCSNGMEALVLWASHRAAVALLLTDLVMPSELSGSELSQRLRGEKPRLQVIYMSGYSAEFAGRQMELRPGENFLQKPFSPDQLLAAVRRMLDT